MQVVSRWGLLVLFVSILTAPLDAAPLLWNKLGSSAEVQNSAYGPNLTFYGGGDPFGQIANPAYVPGVFGNALTIGPGGYSTPLRVYNVLWNSVDQYLNADRGTIETWFKQNTDPVGFSHGVYRIFDGSYGLGSGVGLTSEATTNSLNFGVSFGGTSVGVQTNISAMNGTWIHVAGVWDRAGIANSSDTLRLYLNGAVVASTTASNWGSVVGQRADIGGGNDANIAGKFEMDNLKVYDVAMTDFSNRFDEPSLPEPASAAAIALAGLTLIRRRPRRVA
jgi:hypothetical protein